MALFTSIVFRKACILYKSYFKRILYKLLEPHADLFPTIYDNDFKYHMNPLLCNNVQGICKIDYNANKYQTFMMSINTSSVSYLKYILYLNMGLLKYV